MVLTASTLFITRHHVFVVPPLSAFSIPIGITFVDGIELFKLRCFILLDIGNEASHLPRRMARSGLLQQLPTPSLQQLVRLSTPVLAQFWDTLRGIAPPSLNIWVSHMLHLL
jgi:hypothetical protein